MHPSCAKSINRAIASTSPGGLLLSVFTIAMTHAVSSVNRKVTTTIVGAVLRRSLRRPRSPGTLPIARDFTWTCRVIVGDRDYAVRCSGRCGAHCSTRLGFSCALSVRVLRFRVTNSCPLCAPMMQDAATW